MAAAPVPRETATPAPARTLDMRALWRLTAWGGAAALALMGAVFALQSENGRTRIASLMAADLATDLPVRPVATIAIPQEQAEIARLQTQVRTLAVDRDRLAAQLAALERNVEDITGSIKRAEEANRAAPTPEPSSTVAKTEPSVAAPPSASASGSTAPVPEQAGIRQTNVASSSAQTVDSTRKDVPLPPDRLAAAAPAGQALEMKPEFGVALASSTSLDVLHLQWAALKANFGPMLGGLRPIAAREQRGTATTYRLVLGPMPNLTAAQKLCGRLIAARAPCHAGKFAGEPL